MLRCWSLWPFAFPDAHRSPFALRPSPHSAVGLVSIRDIGSVIQMVEKSGCTVTKVKSTKMSTDRAASFNGNS